MHILIHSCGLVQALAFANTKDKGGYISDLQSDTVRQQARKEAGILQSCRRVLDTLELETGGNASLLMARYIKSLDDKNDSKRALFDAMTHAASNARARFQSEV